MSHCRAHREGDRGSGRGDPRARATGRRADARRTRRRGDARRRSRRSRAVRHPGQQCRHQPAGAVRRRQGRGFRFRHSAQRARRLFRGAGGGAAADRSQSSPARSSTCRRRWAMSAARRRTVYCATKHAMEGFTKAMAIELAPHKIRVNTLAPTFIETPMTRPFFQNEAFRNGYAQAHQARPPRPARGPDRRDRVPGERRLGADDRHVAGGRRRLDGGIARASADPRNIPGALSRPRP